MEREDIARQYKWNTKDIFVNDSAWEKLFIQIEKKINFSQFVGQLNTEENIAKFLQQQEEFLLQLERLYLYAHLKHDEDTKVAKYIAMQSKAMSLYVRYSTETAFVLPELLSLPLEKLEELQHSHLCKDYDYFFKQLIAQKAYLLPAEQEKILAMTGEVFNQFKNIFSMIDNADMQFGEVENIPLSHASYNKIMHGTDRELRKKAFQKYYACYMQRANTIAATYYGNVQKNVFITKVRGYEHCLQKALIAEDVAEIVYDNLIAAVHESLVDMYDYIKFRKSALHLKEMHFYDIYTPIVATLEKNIPYEDGYKIVKNGLKALGEDYLQILDEAYHNGWIDVYESKGKRSGAYSSGIYNIHPYVLLNYNNTVNDVFTVAHEMGHAIHTYYANQSQCYAKADYRIFVAEVASTVNEVLLLKHMLKTSTDKEELKYYYNYYLDMMRGTLFRQTLFAEFEVFAHTQVQAGIPLTVESMNAYYLTLNKNYYGDSIVYDDEIAYEWARIPHFYNAFYVYKYATGIISAISIVDKILKEGESAVVAYKNFLRAGGSDSPVELLKIVGIDLTQKQAFETAMHEFKNTLEKLKEV